jgi:O-antigen/teichoic acid export membrane protein
MFARTVRNVFSNWAGLGVAMAIAYFMAPFLVHRLGDAQYGVWILVLSVTGYMGLLDGGLKATVVRYVAAQVAHNDQASLGETVSTALAIYGVLALVLLALAALVGPFLDLLFEIPAELHDAAHAILLIASATLAMSLLASVFNGFLAGLQRYDLVNMVSITLALAGAGGLYLVVSRGFGVVGMALVQLGVQVASGLLLYTVARRLWPGLEIGYSRVRLARLKELYGYSVFVLINSIAMLLLFRSGELIAGVLLGAAAVTYFAIGGMLVDYLAKIIGTMTQVLHPLASAQHATGDRSGIRSALIFSTRACLSIALPACAGFVILGAPFIAAWMGKSYAEVSGPILAVLAMARLFWLSQSGAGNILMGAGRHRQLTAFTATAGLAGIILAVVFANRFGLLGIAAGQAIATFLTLGVALPIFVCRSFGIGMPDYLRNAVAGPVLATIPFAGAMYALAREFQPASVGAVAGIVLASAPVYVAIAWFACLDAGERLRLKSLVTARRGN